MAYSASKFHVGINGEGYLLSDKRGVKYYEKKKAAEFVNKFGSGDSSWRDNTFWQFFAQTNWRNGAKQLKFDDAGKFWKSSDVDTSELEKLRLSKAFVSTGQLAASIKVNTLEAWRSSTSWYNSSYGYRQQITITAPSDKQVPAGYPIKVTINTATLETASKVLANRNDWRIVYWNGSAWVDLTRDYVSASVTFFPLQVAINANQSDSNYYAYYGYSSESTNKQPTTEALWNEVYFGTGWDDANVKAIYHFREGTGTTVNDDSSKTNTGTLAGTTSWTTDNSLGRGVDFGGATADKLGCGAGSDFDLPSNGMTLEAWIYLDASVDNSECLIRKQGETNYNAPYYFGLKGNKVCFSVDTGGGTPDITGSTTLSTGTLYHVAATHDSVSVIKVYLNGTQDGSTTKTTQGISSSQPVEIGKGFNGKIYHARISAGVRTSFPYALATQPTTSYGSEITTQPPSTSFDLYGGGSDGKVYKWDGTTTWTEQFDCRRLEWFETGTDANEIVGDEGGTEKAKSQGFQVDATCTIKSLAVYLKKNAGTPGDITVRIETDSTNKPSGTLAHANATGTITAFTGTSYAWKEIDFAGIFTLTGSTTYHIVLKTAAAANDQNYAWAADASSPGYSAGAQSYSINGGSTWTADATKDQYFRLLGNSTEVLSMLLTSVGGTQKLYIGTGNSTGETNGDARLYSYDGSTWALTKIFNTATESMISSMAEYTDTTKVYFGLGPQAKVYETSDFSTFTLSKDINVPQNPGYVYAMTEYNSILYAGGGSPEFLPAQYYNGFLNYYDSTKWRALYPFDFTVIKSFSFYDAYLFIGTYHGHTYIFDTSSLTPLFSFKEDYEYKVTVLDMQYYDDKLYFALYPQVGTNETNVGVWKFDRRGMSLAHTISGVTGYRCFTIVNGTLFVGTGDDGYVYKLNENAYASSGWYQSSYFDANLPNYDKLYNQVVVKHDPLTEGQSVVVKYKFKEADSWTTLGTSNTVGAIEKTLSFAAGTSSKKISLRVELATTNTSTTPTLTEVVMRYSLYPTRKWQWNMRLKLKENIFLLDGTQETRTAAQMRTALENLLSTQSLYTFVDIDETSYTVMVVNEDQSSWVINKDTTNEDEINISLLEA